MATVRGSKGMKLGLLRSLLFAPWSLCECRIASFSLTVCFCSRFECFDHLEMLRQNVADYYSTKIKNTPSVSNYKSFDFFNLKFDHSSYSKICTKYRFFYHVLFYHYKIFKNDLYLTIFAQNFQIRPIVKFRVKKSQTNYNLKRR